MNIPSTMPNRPPSSIDGSIPSTRPVPPGGKNGPPPTTKPGPVGPATKPGVPRPAPAPPAAETDAPRGGTNPPTPVPDDMFNVEGLLADWGKKDSVYDLDESGSVDGWDLALFLGGQRPKTEDAAYNVQGLLDQWGQSDSPYDLDGNGTVDGWDLALFQGGQRPGDSTASQADDHTASAGGANNATDAAAPTGGTQESQAASGPRADETQQFLNRFTNHVMHAAGIGDQRSIPLDSLNVNERIAGMLDPDGDGVVMRGELQRAIQTSVSHAMQNDQNFNVRKWTHEWINWLGGPVNGQPGEASDALVSRPGTPIGAEPREAALARLTSFVSDKFEAAGFSKHPPRNLHEIISAFDLKGTDRTLVLKQLADRYPNGLGINTVG